jgi:hypothetical protein
MDRLVSRRSSHPEPVTDLGTSPTVADLVPRRSTLDGFATEVDDFEGINVREAEPLVPILVTTRHSRYRIVPLRWGSAEVLVQGGRFFPEPTEVRLVGATFGGSLLEMNWIRVGMHMEIDPGTADGPIITTQVADVRIDRNGTTGRRPH